MPANPLSALADIVAYSVSPAAALQRAVTADVVLVVALSRRCTPSGPRRHHGPSASCAEVRLANLVRAVASREWWGRRHGPRPEAGAPNWRAQPADSTRLAKRSRPALTWLSTWPRSISNWANFRSQ